MRKLYWLSLAVVVYGSLFPFNFVVPDIGDIDVDEIFSVNSAGDILSNILLFVPIGVLACLSGKGDKRQATLLLALAIALSILVQFLQAFVPARYPGLLDIAMNLLGLTFGVFAAGSVDALIRRHLDLNFDMPGPVVVLCALFLVGQLFPFIPVLTLSGLKRNYWSMLIVSRNTDWIEIAEHAVFWILILSLIAPLISDRRWRIGILLSPLAFFGARLVIIGSVASVWHLAGSGLGAIAYVMLRSARNVRLVSIFLVVGLIIFEGVTPLVPRMIPVDFVIVSLQGVSRLTIWRYFLVVIWKTYLYGSLIYLLWLSDFNKVRSITVVAALLLAIEVFQTRYASGVPDLLDPALAILSGLILVGVPPLIVWSRESS